MAKKRPPIRKRTDPETKVITRLRIETNLPWIDQYPCRQCKTIEFDPVMPRGATQPELYIVGEAPGAEEAETKKPFVGRSGKLLQRVLDDLFDGYKNAARYVRISNTVMCRPEGNRTPYDNERDTCSQYVMMDIRFRKPSAVLLLGRTPSRAFFPEEPDHLMREWVAKAPMQWKFADTSFATYFAYHPSYVLRQGGADSIPVYNKWYESIAKAAEAAMG